MIGNGHLLAFSFNLPPHHHQPEPAYRTTMIFVPLVVPALVSCILSIRLTAAALTSTGQTLLLDDIPYYVPATPYTKVSGFPSLKPATSANGLVPVTVLGLPSTDGSLTTIQSIIAGFSAVDDVWSQGFLDGKYAEHSGSSHIECCIYRALCLYTFLLGENTNFVDASRGAFASMYRQVWLYIRYQCCRK